MSASMMITFLLCCAKATARFVVKVVLPSPGMQLVTRRTLGTPPARESMMEVRSARQASAAPELGSLSIRIGLETGTCFVAVFALVRQKWHPIRPDLLPQRLG